MLGVQPAKPISSMAIQVPLLLLDHASKVSWPPVAAAVKVRS